MASAAKNAFPPENSFGRTWYNRTTASKHCCWRLSKPTAAEVVAGAASASNNETCDDSRAIRVTRRQLEPMRLTSIDIGMPRTPLHYSRYLLTKVLNEWGGTKALMLSPASRTEIVLAAASAPILATTKTIEPSSFLKPRAFFHVPASFKRFAPGRTKKLKCFMRKNSGV